MYKAFFLFLVTVIWVVLMILLIKPDMIKFNIYLLQLCLEKETSWQAKEGAVMCKFCNILSATIKP